MALKEIFSEILTFIILYVKVIIALLPRSFFYVKNSLYIEVLKMRVKITLACGDCKQRNYITMKNKKNDPDRIEIKKYCKFCHKHTVHKETK